MKHIFIINPAAGHADMTERLKSSLEPFQNSKEIEIYQTTGKGDATRYTDLRCRENSEQKLRFYACGGDGTLSEVVNGAVGHKNASVTVYPCGSGNDYVKYYGGADAFQNLAELFDAEDTPVDLMKIGERYCINVANFGFDTAVVVTMEKLRRIKGLGGKKAYFCGIATALAKDMRTGCTVTADGEKLNKRDILLCTVSNGVNVGSSFRCAPYSDNSDGLLEVCLVKPLSRIKFFRIISSYMNGTHIENPLAKPYIAYRRAKAVELEFEKSGYLCIDGELILGERFRIEVCPQALRFAVPSGALARPVAYPAT